MLNLIYPIWMCIMSRLHGWGGFTGCRELSQFCLALPFAYIASKYNISHYYSVIVLILTYLTYTLGNEGGYELANNAVISPITNFIANIFNITNDSNVYHSLFWFVKGLIISLPLALVSYLALGFDLTIVTFQVMMGLSWMVAYYIAFKTPYNLFLGELLSGILQGLTLLLLVN